MNLQTPLGRDAAFDAYNELVHLRRGGGYEIVAGAILAANVLGTAVLGALIKMPMSIVVTVACLTGLPLAWFAARQFRRQRIRLLVEQLQATGASDLDALATAQAEGRVATLREGYFERNRRWLLPLLTGGVLAATGFLSGLLQLPAGTKALGYVGAVLSGVVFGFNALMTNTTSAYVVVRIFLAVAAVFTAIAVFQTIGQ